MTAHHFIGSGAFSGGLQTACDAGEQARLLAEVTARVRAAGLEVVAERAVPFPGGGATLVWVLSESHLVLHLWPEHDWITLDLHVCDYRDLNAVRARRLRDALDGLCFAPGSSAWRELAVCGPRLVETGT